MTVAYRCEDYLYGNGVDEYGEPYPGSNVQVVIKELPIVKETPKGFWVQSFVWGSKRFVLNQGKKRYAYRNKQEAIENYIVIKNYRINHLMRHVRKAEVCIHLAEGLKRCLQEGKEVSQFSLSL